MRPREEELRIVSDIVRAAGREALGHFGRVERLTKTHAAADAEAVTLADRACQRLIVSHLREAFPGDGVIGEEDDAGTGITFDVPEGAGRAWVIDPIDGTNNFVAGLGNFAVCVGLIEEGEPVLGCVLDVTRNQLYRGAIGVGAFRDDVPVRALTDGLSSRTLLMLTSFLHDGHGEAPRWASRLLAQSTWKLRMLGSAALDMATVAAGVAHGAITVNGKLWDVAAPAAILRAAGGVVTRPDGGAIFPFELAGYSGAKVPFLAAGKAAHPELVAYLKANV